MSLFTAFSSADLGGAACVTLSNLLETTQGRAAAAGGEAHEGLQLWAAKLGQHLQVSPWVSALQEDQHCQEVRLSNGICRRGSCSWVAEAGWPSLARVQMGSRHTCIACLNTVSCSLTTLAHHVKQAIRHVVAAAIAIAVGGMATYRLSISLTPC